MEWYFEKGLLLIPSIVLSLWTVFVYRQNRADQQAQAHDETTADVTIAHLTEGSTLRRDLREMLKDANARIDKIEEILLRANQQINELRGTVADLSIEKKVLEREKKMLEEDILRREQLFNSENNKLRARVTDLEKQVEQLKSCKIIGLTI